MKKKARNLLKTIASFFTKHHKSHGRFTRALLLQPNSPLERRPRKLLLQGIRTPPFLPHLPSPIAAVLLLLYTREHAEVDAGCRH
ncbi:hypothetical protein ACFX16_024697 [Malus domestica]